MQASPLPTSDVHCILMLLYRPLTLPFGDQQALVRATARTALFLTAPGIPGCSGAALCTCMQVPVQAIALSGLLAGMRPTLERAL